MTLPNKLPKDPLYKTSEMTEADWKEYFECRKKYDVEYTKEQRTECCNRAGKLFAEGKKEDADKIIGSLPIAPLVAFNLKTFAGLKNIQTFNLSEAKKVFPDEF